MDLSSRAHEKLSCIALLVIGAPMLLSDTNAPAPKVGENRTSACLRGTAYNVQTAKSNPVNITGNLVKFRAGPGMYWPEDVRNDRIRSELQSRSKMLPGSKVAVRYSVKVTAEPSLLSRSLVLGQFHATSDKGDFQGYPVFELNLSQLGLAIYTASISAAHQTIAYPRTLRASGIPFTLGKWHAVSVDMVDGFNSDGSLCVKIDGKIRYCQTGISVGMNDAIGPYWKFGLYYTPADAKMILSASYKDMVLNRNKLDRSCR